MASRFTLAPPSTCRLSRRSGLKCHNYFISYTALVGAMSGIQFTDLRNINMGVFLMKDYFKTIAEVRDMNHDKNQVIYAVYIRHSAVDDPYLSSLWTTLELAEAEVKQKRESNCFYDDVWVSRLIVNPEHEDE